jgi:hypothetical protein
MVEGSGTFATRRPREKFESDGPLERRNEERRKSSASL